MAEVVQAISLSITSCDNLCTRGQLWMWNVTPVILVSVDFDDHCTRHVIYCPQIFHGFRLILMWKNLPTFTVPTLANSYQNRVCHCFLYKTQARLEVWWTRSHHCTKACTQFPWQGERHRACSSNIAYSDYLRKKLHQASCLSSVFVQEEYNLVGEISLALKISTRGQPKNLSWFDPSHFALTIMFTPRQKYNHVAVHGWSNKSR